MTIMTVVVCQKFKHFRYLQKKTMKINDKLFAMKMTTIKMFAMKDMNVPVS